MIAIAKKQLLLGFICGAFVQPLLAQNSLTLPINPPLQNKKFSGHWRLDLKGLESQDDFNQKSIFEFKFHTDFEFKLNSWLMVKMSPSFKSASGHTQTETPEENQSQFYVREATANLMPFSKTQLALGALNMGKTHSSLLLDDSTAFPGGRLELSTGDTWQAGLMIEQAIPTSKSLTANSKEKEVTPSFSSAGILVANRHSLAKMSLRINGFTYRDLPSQVASSSGLKGNLVTSTNSGDANFINEFQGTEAIIATEFNLLAKARLNLAASALQNNKAPSKYNQAQHYEGSLDWLISSKWMLSPSLATWRIEPDSTVAQFNDSSLYSNRSGYKLGLALQNQKAFRIKVSGGEKEAVFESPTQTREKFIELKLETLNAQF